MADGAVVEGAYRLAGPGWAPEGQWWLGVHHREEAARGLHPDEDLWYAGRFAGELDAPATRCRCAPGPVDLDRRSRRRPTRGRGGGPAAQPGGGGAAKPADDVDATLALAADAFVVRTDQAAPDVVAGYPWFGAWSRDTMISYEGLFLCTGAPTRAGSCCGRTRRRCPRGCWPTPPTPAGWSTTPSTRTLWFLHAVSRHVTVTGDTDLGAELLPALGAVIDAHLAGTRYGIRGRPGRRAAHPGRRRAPR